MIRESAVGWQRDHVRPADDVGRRVAGVLVGFAVIGVLVGTGYLLARTGVVPAQSRTILNNTAFFAVSPALLFTVLAKSDLEVAVLLLRVGVPDREGPARTRPTAGVRVDRHRGATHGAGRIQLVVATP